MHTGFWWGHLEEGDYFEDLGIDREGTLKSVLE
jgi:hypothetical protein